MAFGQAHPDVSELLEASGFGDHPAIVEASAILGRRYATMAGDPTTITTRKAGTPMADNTATKDIEARIDALQGDIEKAQAQHDYTTANRLYQEQLALGQRLPGGSDQVVGSSGGPVT